MLNDTFVNDYEQVEDFMQRLVKLWWKEGTFHWSISTTGCNKGNE